MKAKYFFGAILMAFLGAVIALFAYSRIQGKRSPVTTNGSSNAELKRTEALLTSLSDQQAQPVDLTFAAELTVPTVVHVHTVSTVENEGDNPIMQWFYGNQYNKPQKVSGWGSGVIISSDGYIITNNHVIEDADNIEVTLNDNRKFKAEVIGRDPSTDIAVLKIKADNLPFIKYGDSDRLKLGEWVLAVGNPFNLTSTVTAGIVSAKGRNLQLINSDYSIEAYIQTDAALNMGNSGGALVNTKGELVGITSAIISPSGAYAGNSFAIPINIVRKVVDDLRKYGEVQRAIIGVRISEVTQDDADKLKLPEVSGAKIADVTKNGAAESAGLKANDVIVKLDGVSVATPAELQEQVGKHRPGDRVNITYLRNGKEFTVPLVLKNLAGNTSIVKPGSDEQMMGVVYGARFEALSSSDKSKYNIDYGVKVSEVNSGKFKDIGLKKGYIILNVNGHKVKSAADVREAASNEGGLQSIEGIQPDGTFFSYTYRS
jgi:serine protease Do